MRNLFILIVLALASPTQAKIYNVGISADGKTYAVLRDLEDKQVVAFYSVDDTDAKPIAVGLGGNKTDGFAWRDSDHVLVRLTDIKRNKRLLNGLEELNFSRWVSLDAGNGEMEMLFDNVKGQDHGYYIEESGELLATLPEERSEAVFSRATVRSKLTKPSRLDQGRDELVNGVHRVNVGNGRVKRDEWGNENTWQWVLDETGKIVGRADYHEARREMDIFVSNGGSLKPLTTIDYDAAGITSFYILGRVEDAASLIVRVKTPAEFWEYRQLDMTTGALSAADVSPSGSIKEIYDPRRARARSRS